MDYQVKLSRSARSDIQDIIRYISIDDPHRALRFGKFLIQHTESLGQFPERGRIVPEFEDESIREIIVRAYRVVYRVSHDQRSVEVIRFGTLAEAVLSSLCELPDAFASSRLIHRLKSLRSQSVTSRFDRA